MQALQYTCWHSLKQRQPEPSFSTKQIPQPKILLSNAFCLCTSSKSRSWGRRSTRGSNRGTARGSNRDDEGSWGSCFSFVTSLFFSKGSQRLSHWGCALKKVINKRLIKQRNFCWHYLRMMKIRGSVEYSHSWLVGQDSCVHSLLYSPLGWSQGVIWFPESPKSPLWETGSTWKVPHNLDSPPTAHPVVCTDSSSKKKKKGYILSNLKS